MIHTTVLEIPHIIETETLQIVELDSTQIISRIYSNNRSNYNLSHVKTPKIEIITIQIDKEIIISHHTEITHFIYKFTSKL